MELDWVQDLLKQSLGYNPFPATLNVRPTAAADAAIWQRAQNELAGVPLAPTDDGYCSARLFRIEIRRGENAAGEPVAGAILLPEVKDYPKDKIEVVAPMRLKDHLGVNDGDTLTLEFLN
jgi:CTP-dependent riboflavin kinase